VRFRDDSGKQLLSLLSLILFDLSSFFFLEIKEGVSEGVASFSPMDIPSLLRYSSTNARRTFDFPFFFPTSSRASRPSSFSEFAARNSSFFQARTRCAVEPFSLDERRMSSFLFGLRKSRKILLFPLLFAPRSSPPLFFDAIRRSSSFSFLNSRQIVTFPSLSPSI